MKIKNKYVATGMGIALAFTSTCINYGYFTASESQVNTITIGQENQTSNFGLEINSTDYYNCGHSGDGYNVHNRIDLEYTITNKGTNATYDFSIDVGNTSNEFKNTTLETYTSRRKTYIKLTKNSGKYDISKGKVIVINVTETKPGCNPVTKTYKIEFSHDYYYDWGGLQHQLKSSISDVTGQTLELEEEIIPEIPEETPNDTLPPGEGTTEPEETPNDTLPPEEGTTEPEETPNDTLPPENESKPEETPNDTLPPENESKPEDTRPEKPQKPDDIIDPEKDTPTILPIEN